MTEVVWLGSCLRNLMQFESVAMAVYSSTQWIVVAPQISLTLVQDLLCHGLSNC